MSWDVSDLSNVEFLDAWLPDGGENWSALNVFVLDDMLYISYYIYGLQVLDITDPSNLELVAFYDTFDQETDYIYTGAWGAFPYFGSDNVLISDRVTGLYVVDVEGAVDDQHGDINQDMEINIMDIPFAQRGIVQIANSNKIPCFIATNVLESLINGNLPTRAELNDIVGTLEMGASGIVLAAETAIGKKPILCAEIVNELMHRFNLYKTGLLFADIERNEITDKEMKLWLNR